MFTNGQITAVNLGFPLADTQVDAQSRKTQNISSFQDFFSSSSKAYRADKNSPVGSSYTERANAGNTADVAAKQKAFRQFEKDMKVGARKAMLQGKKEPAAEPGESEAEESGTGISNSQKADLMLNCLAQVMGVNADELARLLEEAGISPKELAALSGSDTLGTKLAQALGLDGKMGNTLAKILQLIDTQVGDAISKGLSGEADGKSPEGMPEGLELNTAGSSGGVADTEMTGLSSLLSEIRQRLKEMGEKLEKNEMALVEEITLNIRSILGEKLKVQMNPVETGELEGANAGNGESMGSDPAAAEESNADKSENGTQQAADSEVVLPQQASAADTQETAQAFGNTINQLLNKETEAGTESLRMRAPVTGKEILAQVLAKAKVVLTADKSEMIIDLKPDSLGKLSLKVATEQGVVMAKFVAESQQVKQVLESNMQLLKESLEKQGLNVQGFSVSVRQESQSSRHDFNSNGDGTRRAPVAQMPGSGGIYADAADIERLQRMNPYRQEGSTINLTA